jgi:signal-transduction protein with cAMP-binding, CBS, and nucleotidyltransferase domain
MTMSAVVVTENGKVAGILTDRDIALKVTLGPATADSPVADVMTRDVVTIWDDQGVFNATQYLRGRKVRRLPIIERDGRLVGILAADDLFAAARPRVARRRRGARASHRRRFQLPGTTTTGNGPSQAGNPPPSPQLRSTWGSTGRPT